MPSSRPDTIEQSITAANELLRQYEDLTCCRAWRSVGSVIFCEFGMPSLKRVTPATAPAFTIVRGQVSIGVHADFWRMRWNGRPILDSASVDDAVLNGIFKSYLSGLRMPVFHMVPDGSLSVVFNEGAEIVLVSNDYPTTESDAYDEVTVRLPDAAWRFNYRRGFHRVS